MAQEIEIEYKNLLTEEEYARILGQYPFPKQAATQTNYYFETDDFSLKQKGCALRIREKNGKFVLTLKEPHTSGLLETHDPLTEQEADNWLHGAIIPKDNVMCQLKAMHIPIDKIVYYGKLTTSRREVTYDQALIVLDHSMYNGSSDYELEVEAPSEAIGISVFESVLQHNAIKKRETPNKIKRFFATR